MASILKQFFTVSGHSVILKGFLHQSLFQVLLLSSVYSSQREYFITFYTNTHSLSSFLQSFNYLITYPQGNCFHLHGTTFQLFQFFGTNIIFFSTLMETFRFFKKSFPLSFTNPIIAYSVYKVRFYGLLHAFFSVSFPSLFRRTRHGGIGQRSDTRLETPLLGWALPLKILNHMSLGVDVPVFFHPGDVASFSYFFS